MKKSGKVFVKDAVAAAAIGGVVAFFFQSGFVSPARSAPGEGPPVVAVTEPPPAAPLQAPAAAPSDEKDPLAWDGASPAGNIGSGNPAAPAPAAMPIPAPSPSPSPVSPPLPEAENAEAGKVQDVAPPASPPVASPPPAAAFEELEKRIGALEQAVERLQAEKNAVRREAASEQDSAAPKAKKKKTPRRKAAKPSAPAVEWVLKSARPGSAWVAQKGSDVLREVAVGDRVEGLGRITAIIKDSAGLWVVNGTGGRISQ